MRRAKAQTMLWINTVSDLQIRRGNKNNSEVTLAETVLLSGHNITGDNHVTCGQLSKPDVATLSYRRSHY